MKKILFILLVIMPTAVRADDARDLLDYLDRQWSKFEDVAMDLWDYAELGYLETKSRGRLQKLLS